MQEAAKDVHHIVGVHRGEDQVAGEGGLDGDLGRFLVANLTHHDLVGVVAKNRAQPPGKGEALLDIHRDLGDTGQLILNRVLDGNDLVLFALDLRQGRVEGGGLATRWGR